MGQVIAFTRRKMLHATAVEEQTSRSSPKGAEPLGAELLSRVATGEHAALAEFYDATCSVVFSLALRILGDRLPLRMPLLKCILRCGPKLGPMTLSVVHHCRG